MNKFFTSSIGRLRAMAFLEGLSLILLLFIAMPLKYGFGLPAMVKVVGMAHGVLFIGFVLLTLMVSIEQRWSFLSTTWKVLLSSMVPFGTFYIDKKILEPMHSKKE
jgi:integral membrane protein